MPRRYRRRSMPAFDPPEANVGYLRSLPILGDRPESDNLASVATAAGAFSFHETDISLASVLSVMTAGSDARLAGQRMQPTCGG